MPGIPTRAGTHGAAAVNDKVIYLYKTHGNAINSLQQQASSLQTQITTNVASLQQQITANAETAANPADLNVSNQITGPNGNGLYNWSSSSYYPLSDDPNTGSSWATGERDYINNLVALVNFMYEVLVDAGIIS